jgi:hypothetical protein
MTHPFKIMTSIDVLASTDFECFRRDCLRGFDGVEAAPFVLDFINVKVESSIEICAGYFARTLDNDTRLYILAQSSNFQPGYMAAVIDRMLNRIQHNSRYSVEYKGALFSLICSLDK